MVYASYLQACLQAIQKQFWVWSTPGLDSLLSWMEMMITKDFPNIKQRVEDLKRNEANQQILESTLLTWSAIIRRAAQEENPSRRGCLSPLFKSFSCNPQNIKGGFQKVCFCLCYTNQGFTFYLLHIQSLIITPPSALQIIWVQIWMLYITSESFAIYPQHSIEKYSKEVKQFCDLFKMICSCLLAELAETLQLFRIPLHTRQTHRHIEQGTHLSTLEMYKNTQKHKYTNTNS